MQLLVFTVIYLIFFLSGAAALIYEVVWVRSLTLIFGGSHLAVTTVLSVFMGGLALGSYIIGRKTVSCAKLLRVYGFLELGIAASALLFVGLIRFYPALYVPLAGIAVSSPLYLSCIRVVLGAVALIIPTTLMGGTLPVLSSFIVQRSETLGTRLSFLYGFNTLGAVAGAGAAGFFFLRVFSASTTLWIAVSINVLAGILSIFFQDKAQVILEKGKITPELAANEPIHTSGAETPLNFFSLKLVVWGIGVSGFCALAYEVLWTRILSIVVGASVYGFTIILTAFLAGIALGSAAYGLLLRISGKRKKWVESDTRLIRQFGLVQIIIGLAALFVTMFIRNLPTESISLFEFFSSMNRSAGPFETRQLANFLLAFLFMFVPAFFMGVAFPLAGKIHGRYKKVAGQAVGEILTFNTIGAILGSAVSGFVLIYLLGIQRSLLVIILINIWFGLFVIARDWGRRGVNWVVSAAIGGAVLMLFFMGDGVELWDSKFYAIYQSNHPEMYRSAESIHDAMKNNDVLYYGEGVQSIVSSVQSGLAQFFITNGRVEASNSNEGMQCQYTLGHLPMLLNKNPKKVFVLGTGSGMTLGSTAVHPSVEKIMLAEIEPKVLGVTRTFGIYNHYVLDNPKVEIVFNDGRNFLMTTKEKFDVITADPVHPWFSGAGYLYSTEYFKLAARRLNPGGILCQWLPLYELSEDNLKSVVKTLRENFAFTMVWLTHDDAELVGSNSPIIIDQDELERRIRVPEVLQDLQRVKMGSAEDFLSYFVMGNAGTKAYSSGGWINTDDNLYLEFSAPRNIGNARCVGDNALELVKYRENILRYFGFPRVESVGAGRKEKWEQNQKAAVLYDRAHILHLAGLTKTAEYQQLTAELDARFPRYAPWRFLKDETFDKETSQMKGSPILLKQRELEIISEQGEAVKVLFSAIMLRVSEERAKVYFADGNSRIVFGNLRVRGGQDDVSIVKFVEDVFKKVETMYREEQNKAVAGGKPAPAASSLLPKVKNLVELMADRGM